MAIEGVDYAFKPWPRASELARLGKHFAVRYGGPGTSNKWLDPTEATSLAAAGLSIVANAEGSAQGLLGGFAVGASWARTADSWFRKCGMPSDRPIYLSVDFDCTSTQWPSVRDALAGAASEIGLARVGVYGGRRVIQWARRDEVASWLWQTYAWSGGVWEAGTHLQQYRNGVTLDGADCDLDRAMTADFGQWQPGISYGPAPGGEDDVSDAYELLVTGERPGNPPSQTHTPEPRYPSIPNTETLDRIWRAAIDARYASDRADEILVALKTGGIPPADLAAAFKTAILDPEVLAAIAVAVNDEDHRRSAG